MLVQIRKCNNGEIIQEIEANSFKAALELLISKRADLYGADLRGADLYGADLRGADLYGANLDGADFDFSCWPLHCRSFGAKADDRLVSQLFAHLARLDVSNCSGGVKESVEFIRSMAISDLFCEYRSDINRIE